MNRKRFIFGVILIAIYAAGFVFMFLHMAPVGIGMWLISTFGCLLLRMDIRRDEREQELENLRRQAEEKAAKAEDTATEEDAPPCE